MNKTRKRGLALLFAAVLTLAAFSGCSGAQDSEDGLLEDGGTLGQQVPGADEDGSWDPETAVYLTMNGDSIAVDGTGVRVDGAVATITAAGTYVLSGTLDDGQVVVDAAKSDRVQIVLNGVEIASSTSAPVYSASADVTVVTIEAGTENKLTDAAEYHYPDESAAEPDAALFVKDDLVINGGGSLAVVGSYNNGIGAKDNLTITGGTIDVSAANHGIRGRDSLSVTGGTITVEAGNDGLQSNNDAGEDVGWIRISGGDLDITSSNDGVQAESTLTVTGGTVHILAGGGSAATPEDSDGSYKGLKAGTDLAIEGGAITIDAADDTLHANHNVTISGGDLTLSSGDDGVHADETLAISGGTIDILTSYEGLEGSYVEISGGTVKLAASDDGINAAGGADSGAERGPGGRFGGDSFSGLGDYYIDISGGWIEVTAAGDGIDSNNNINMSGGTLLIHGPTSGGDAAIDYDGTFTLTGGVIAAAGSTGMAQAPGDASTQASLMVYYSSVQSAGTTVHLAAQDGTALLTFTPQKEYGCIVITTPQLEEGGTYKLFTGGTNSADADGYLVLGGSYSGGTELCEVTLSGATTRISDTGEAYTGGFGGFGGFGGGGPGGMGGTPPGGGMPGNGGPGGERLDGDPPSAAGAPPDWGA